MATSGLNIAQTGLNAQQFQAATTANNLANAATPGYKVQKPVFKELMYQKIRQPGGVSDANSELPSGLMLGTGVTIAGTMKDFKSGNPIRTDMPYDMFINGRGFFEVALTDGSKAYTRDGKFHPNADGVLVDNEGRQLSPTISIQGAIQSVNIGKDGTVAVMRPGDKANTQIGTITLTDFTNPAGLEPIGSNLYVETAASGQPITGNPGSNGLGQIEQLSIEGSNVNVVEELVALIEGQRSYEMNAKAIESIDNELQFAVQVL